MTFLLLSYVLHSCHPYVSHLKCLAGIKMISQEYTHFRNNFSNLKGLTDNSGMSGISEKLLEGYFYERGGITKVLKLCHLGEHKPCQCEMHS